MKVAIITLCSQVDLVYLDEWIDYYMFISSDIELCIYILLQGSITSYSGKYRSNNRVKFIERQSHPLTQGWTFYDQCYFSENLQSLYDYVCLFEIDEFLFLGKYKTLADLLNTYCAYEQLYIHWRMIGNQLDDANNKSSDKSITRFVHGSSKLHAIGKSIINTRLMTANNRKFHLSYHSAVYTDILRSKLILKSNEVNYRVFYDINIDDFQHDYSMTIFPNYTQQTGYPELYHYHLKTLPEFIIRKSLSNIADDINYDFLQIGIDFIKYQTDSSYRYTISKIYYKALIDYYYQQMDELRIGIKIQPLKFSK